MHQAPRDEQATYLLPLLARNTDGFEELAAYLNALPVRQVIVVDASPVSVFDALQRTLSSRVLHVRPDAEIKGCNGKVRNVLTGLALAEFERIVIGDDDVRYNAYSLRRVLKRLDSYDVVRPQNYFAPLPWHAWLDTGRILINRSLDGDWPGTLAFRRSMLPYGYSPDVLFENFELVRTIRARGGRECIARDVYVIRRPPAKSHFLSQRVRQAYDEFARPVRLLAALAILPAMLIAAALHAWYVPAAIAGPALLAGAIGRYRNGGARYFPAHAIVAAPLWLAERAVCAWLALYERLRYGGVRYAGAVVRDPISPLSELQRKWAH